MDRITYSLEAALDRIDEFRALHDGRPLDESVEAVRCLQEAVGIGDDTRVLIRHRIYGDERLSGGRSQMFLGVIVGLLAAEFDRDRRE